MVCRNCGKILEEGEIFCPACGTKAEPQTVPETESIKQPSYSGIAYEPETRPDTESALPPSYTSVTYTSEPQQTSAEIPQYGAAPAKAELPKEKEYFGKGALVLCLIIIAILSGTAGAFAYLYFSVIGSI